MAERWEIEARSLAAFRAGLGTMLALETLSRLPYLASHYSDAGVLPRAAALPGFLPAAAAWPFPHFWSGSAAWAGLLCALTTAAALALAAGRRPRAAAAACLWLYASLWLRDPLVTQACDRILLWLTLWFCLLPPGKAPARGAAAAGLLLQAAAVFFFSALHKLADPAWRSGGALSSVMSESHRLGLLGPRLAAADLPPALTWLVVAWEAAAPLALLMGGPALRVLAAASVAAFAASVGLLLDIGLFPGTILLCAAQTPARRAALSALAALVVFLAAVPPRTPGALGLAGRLQGWDMFLGPFAGAVRWEVSGGARDLPGGLRWRLYREALGRERLWARARPYYAAWLCRGNPAGRLAVIKVRGTRRETLSEADCPSEEGSLTPPGAAVKLGTPR